MRNRLREGPSDLFQLKFWFGFLEIGSSQRRILFTSFHVRNLLNKGPSYQFYAIKIIDLAFWQVFTVPCNIVNSWNPTFWGIFPSISHQELQLSGENAHFQLNWENSLSRTKHLSTVWLPNDILEHFWDPKWLEMDRKE